MTAESVAYRFDGSFDGLLTAVFDSFARHEPSVNLMGPDDAASLFDTGVHEVVTDPDKASRVWRKLRGVLSRGACSALTTAFLTDNREFPGLAMQFISRAVVAGASIERDFSDSAVLAVLNECRRVRGEAHRLLQFIRFQKAVDGTYFAMTEPLFDVLPMAVDHFRDRFSDRPFIIYDLRRDYGYHCHDGEARRIVLSALPAETANGHLPDSILATDERLYRQLWQTYFDAIAIRERLNPRKQRQDMPVRYWKYLTEMNR